MFGCRAKNMRPEDVIESVEDRSTFLKFARSVHAEQFARNHQDPGTPYGPDSMGWENASIERFLEAALAWANDSDFGGPVGLSAANPWRLFAQFLRAGESYE